MTKKQCITTTIFTTTTITIIIIIVICCIWMASSHAAVIAKQDVGSDPSSPGIICIDPYEPDDYPVTAGYQANNTTSLARCIDPALDQDWVYFDITEESNVTIKTLGPEGDTRMWLYDSLIQELGFDDDGGDLLFSRIQQVLLPGVYYIKVDSYNNDSTILEYYIDIEGHPTSELPDCDVSCLWLKSNSIAEGADFWFKVQVSNRRSAPAGPSHIKAYLSTDNDPDFSDDHYLGKKSVSPLGPGAYEDIRWDFTVPVLGKGAYTVWIVIIVDCNNEVTEASEDNIWLSGTSILVNDKEKPSISVTPAALYFNNSEKQGVDASSEAGIEVITALDNGTRNENQNRNQDEDGIGIESGNGNESIIGSGSGSGNGRENEKGKETSLDKDKSEAAKPFFKAIRCDISSLEIKASQKEGFDLFEISGGGYSLHADRAGDPLLPARYVYLLAPPGYRPDEVHIAIKRQRRLNKKYAIFPKQPQSPVSANQATGTLHPLRPDLIHSGKPFPAAPVEFIHCAHLRGRQMLVFRVQPIQYVPADGSVIVNETFEWEFFAQKGDPPMLSYKKHSPMVDKVIQGMVINPGRLTEDFGDEYVDEDEYSEHRDGAGDATCIGIGADAGTDAGASASAVSSAVADAGNPDKNLGDASLETPALDCDYLIITSGKLSNTFQRFAYLKSSLGLRAEVVTTEDIYSLYPGTDKQEQIKHCITDYATNHGTVWVLLGGDDTVAPDRNCYGWVYTTTGEEEDDTIPTDLYYAGLDDFDWNDDGDDRWGEIESEGDTVDLYPDVFIGRAPVRTEPEAEAFVAKTIAYTITPPPFDFSEKALLCGVELWNTWSGKSDSQWRTENMWEQYMDPYWKGACYRFFDTDTDFGGLSYNVTAVNLKDQIDKGYGILFVSSHGSQTLWQLEESRFASSNAMECTNGDRQGIVYTIACNTNAFDGERYSHDPCLSEAFLRNSHGGAVAFIGSSRYGWGNAGISMMPGTSMEYAQEFYRQLFDQSSMQFGDMTDPDPAGFPLRLGAVHASHKMSYAGASEEKDSYRWLQFSINLMGDPHLAVHIEDTGGREGFAIHNNGKADLEITSLHKRDEEPWFDFSPRAPFTIPPGQSQDISIGIDWDAAIPGPNADRLIIESNDRDMTPYPHGVDILACHVPEFEFTASPAQGAFPLLVRFYASAQPLPSSFLWEFGDGQTGTGQDPSHTYTTPGTYSVSLTLSNQCGSKTVTKKGCILVAMGDLCEGDFDGDGDVDVFDLGVFATDFGKTGCLKDGGCRSDFDKDSDVDVFDLGTFASDFSRTNCPIIAP